MPEIIIEPFTYYRSADGKRAFLVADADVPGEWLHLKPGEGRVVLIEWGSTRQFPIYYAYEGFKKLVADGAMVLFTPKL